MNKLQLLEFLTEMTRQFRNDPSHYQRNRHMHEIMEAPPVEVVDAVLVGFINRVGMSQGVDYALYSKDLQEHVAA